MVAIPFVIPSLYASPSKMLPHEEHGGEVGGTVLEGFVVVVVVVVGVVKGVAVVVVGAAGVAVNINK